MRVLGVSFGMPSEAQRLAHTLSQAMIRTGFRVCVAESCTGGLVAKILTDISGSSDWFERGFVTYSNAAKVEMLGVDEALIERDGAVSESVARAMAEGALSHSHADVSVAITGIAGPGGGSEEKPVGTVWLAWAGGEMTRARMDQFHGDRAAVREQSVAAALRGMLGQIEGVRAVPDTVEE